MRESRTDYPAVCVWSGRSVPSGRGRGQEDEEGCLSAPPQPSVIEKLACLCCLGICPFIMQLQNRKTNSGNRPPNVINFAEAGGGGGAKKGGYYCRRKNSNQLQIPSCLVSVTVANYQ